MESPWSTRGTRAGCRAARPWVGVAVLLLGVAARSAMLAAQTSSPAEPAAPGRLVDIGGQHIHLDCTGAGSPTVLLEAGAGDFAMVWSLVQPPVSAFTRVCSYDRGGHAWSDPGTRPRSFAQLALELRRALRRAGERAPFVLVGQSYGGLVVRGFAAGYPHDVAGVVLVDAVHEDEHVVYGGEPHRIRDEARGRIAPPPRLSLDTALLREARRDSEEGSGAGAADLEPPLRQLPDSVQRLWRWAASKPLHRLAWAAEMDWSPEELARMHEARLRDRASLGDVPLEVLARARGDFPEGMRISADSLERERRGLQADLAALSHAGRLVFATRSGHNIQLEEPALVVEAVRSVVEQARRCEARAGARCTVGSAPRATAGARSGVQ